MTKRGYSILIIFSLAFFGSLQADTSIPEKIRLFLSLHDTRGAFLMLEELRNSERASDPETLALSFEYLATISDIEGMRKLYDTICIPLPEDTLEKIAWAVIKASSKAYHPKIRAEALFAAAMTHDAKGMAILNTMLDDPHQDVQQMAIQLAIRFPDEPIQQHVINLCSSGPPPIKLASAQLLATQKARKAPIILQKLLIDSSLSEDDQVNVASLLSSLKEDLDLHWLAKTVQDPRPAMRALAASSVLNVPSKEGLKIILPLANDTSIQVKQVAFEALGLWQSLLSEDISSLHSLFENHLSSSSISLSATAAWALLLGNAHEKAAVWFENSMTSVSKEERLIATSHLVSTGKQGLALAKRLLKVIEDPMCQLNISAYLLYHRYDVQEAAAILQKALMQYTSLLSEQKSGLFSFLGPSTIPHHPAMPRLPESQDLLIRLELLALRCYTDQHVDKFEIEKMLNDRAWGISASAAGFLFQEMAPSFDEVLSPLLSHPTEGVRIQAALLLTIFSKSQHAAAVLQEQYEKASKEGREALLIGFSSLPSSKTLPYLSPLLFDLSPSIRTRAAGALLASMYH